MEDYQARRGKNTKAWLKAGIIALSAVALISIRHFSMCIWQRTGERRQAAKSEQNMRSWRGRRANTAAGECRDACM